jgi:DNA-binding winged helix-turn-helix (wHTH) protein
MSFEPPRLSELAFELLLPVGAAGTSLVLMSTTDTDMVESVWATGVNRKMKRSVDALTVRATGPEMWAWREQTDLFLETRTEMEQRFPSYRSIDASVTALAAMLLEHDGQAVGVMGVAVADDMGIVAPTRAVLSSVADLIGELIVNPSADVAVDDMPGLMAVTDQVILVGDLHVDETAHQVHYRGRAIDLTPLEFELLVALVRHRGQIMSKGQLLQMIWGYDGLSDNVVEAQISGLRRKIGSNRPVIETVRGYGYVIRHQSEIRGGGA